MHLMITAAQIRAARAMLDITAEQLSQESGIAASVIADMEVQGPSDAPSPDREALRHTLERLGISFLQAGDGGAGGAGLRLAAPDHQEGMRPEELNSTNND